MIHLRAFKELFILFFFFFFFSFLFFFSFHSQPTISGEAHGGRRFGKTLVIGLCIVKSDRLSDSHTNHGGESGGRRWDLGAGTLFRFPHIPVPAICFRFSVFPLPCLALRIIMVTLDWLGARIRIRHMHYTYMLCMHVWGPPLHSPGSKNKKI